MRRGSIVYVTVDPDLCDPCRLEEHDQCSLDGEPDCLCPVCTPEHKAANRAEVGR